MLAIGIFNTANAEPSLDALKETLVKEMPGLTIDSLRSTPIPGIVELVSGPDVAYVTADGTHMIQGTLFNIVKRKNLTEQTMSAVRVKEINGIPASALLVFPANGTVKHTITVFTDPSCPFCLRLNGEIQKLNDLGVTVKYALYSRSGNNTLTGRQLSEVLCSADPKLELAKFFAASSREAKGANCDRAAGLETIARIAPRVGLKGTPHIVTDTGMAFSGYQSASELLRTLQGS